MNLMIVLILALGAEVVPENSTSIVLSGEISPKKEETLPLGPYLLPFAEAFVAQGSYSGIWVKFYDRCEDAEYDQMSLFIPSHGEFSVGYDSSKGAYHSRIPELPFRFQTEQSADIYDRRGRPRPLKVELSHWRRRAKDQLSRTSIEFTDCEIVIQEMAIRDNTLSFSGSFECSSEDPERSVSGQFSVNEAPLGVSKVD